MRSDVPAQPVSPAAERKNPHFTRRRRQPKAVGLHEFAYGGKSNVRFCHEVGRGTGGQAGSTRTVHVGIDLTLMPRVVRLYYGRIPRGHYRYGLSSLVRHTGGDLRDESPDRSRGPEDVKVGVTGMHGDRVQEQRAAPPAIGQQPPPEVSTLS